MNKPTDLQRRLESGQGVLLAEISPPSDAAPAGVQQLAALCRKGPRPGHQRQSRPRGHGCPGSRFPGGRPRHRARLAYHHARSQPHRVVSELLAAHALGIRNILCTSGTHQTLGPSTNNQWRRAAKNVYDIDVIQLLQTCVDLPNGAAPRCATNWLVGEGAIAGVDGFCLGAVASPNADPLELQMMRLDKRSPPAPGSSSRSRSMIRSVSALVGRGLPPGVQQKAAILAGIELLGDDVLERVRAKHRPSPRIPEAVLQKVAGKSDPAARRCAAIDLAVETVKQLQGTQGLRGFSISVDGDPDAAEEIIEKAALGKKVTE